MEHTFVNYESLDIDWFACDKNGNIIHFASGGGIIPKLVAHNITLHDELSKYFRSLPISNEAIEVNPKLEEIESFTSIKEKERYLLDYTILAKRGLYSFDKSNVGEFSDKGYHLVVSPKKALHINDLPKEVKNIVQEIVIVDSVLTTNRIIIKSW